MTEEMGGEKGNGDCCVHENRVRELESKLEAVRRAVEAMERDREEMRKGIQKVKEAWCRWSSVYDVRLMSFVL